MALEISIEAYLVKRVEELGGIAVKMNIQGRVGWPDRLVVLHGGRTLYVELKRPKGGRVSATQKHVHAQLLRMGHTVWVLKNRDEIDEAINGLYAEEI